MKKFIAILAVIALMTAMMIAVSAAGEPAIVIDSVTATAGSEVTVNVSTSNLKGVANGKIDIVYDHDALTLNNVAGASGYIAYANGDKVSFMHATGNQADCAVLVLTFTVNADAKCGDHSVSINVIDLYDANYNVMNVAIEAGSVSMDHNWVKSGETAGTCVTPGTIDYTCSICGETKSEEGSIGSHNLVHTPAVNPTCTEDGCGEYWYCATCDCYFADAEGKQNTHPRWLWIGATGHNYVLTSETAGSCIELGSKTYTCSVCGDSYTEDGVIGSHNLKHTAKVEPTCTENGMNEYWYCDVCDCHFADAEGKYNVAYKSLTIPALGHDFAEEFSSDENGHWHKCSRCDATTEVEAHTMEDVIITEAGKYTEGLKIQVCSVCGWTNNEDIIIPPTGDTSNVLVAVIGAFSSVAAAAYITNKRK